MIQKQEISKFSTNILKKPWLLTFIGVLAIGHVGIMAFKKNVLAICVFFAITFILSFFTDFWVVILCISMVISGCFHFKINEGFQSEVKDQSQIANPEEWAKTKLQLLDQITALQNNIDAIKDEHYQAITQKDAVIKAKDVEISANKDKLDESKKIFNNIKNITRR